MAITLGNQSKTDIESISHEYYMSLSSVGKPIDIQREVESKRYSINDDSYNRI